MRKLIIALVVASASLVPGLASSQASATAPAAMSDLQADAPTEYTVQKGDTLVMISKAFSVSADSLRRANGLKSDSLRPGQRLTIPKK